jgi:uncharacterized membrane protein
MLLNISTAHEVIALASVVLVLAILLGLTVLLYRRHYFTARTDQTSTFTLADIRKMHRDGQVSDEEYERMRQSVIGMSAGTDKES